MSALTETEVFLAELRMRCLEVAIAERARANADWDVYQCADQTMRWILKGAITNKQGGKS